MVHSKRKAGRTDAKQDKRDHRLFWCPRVQFFYCRGNLLPGLFSFFQTVIDDVRVLYVMSGKKETRSCGLIRQMISSFV